MTTGLTKLVKQLRTALGRGALAAVGDPELIRRFADDRDEVAFAELVHRHAAAVYAMCRRHLSQPADLDDAFQATFVVLARKGSTLSRPDRLSGWLCGVADRVARKARRKAARRAWHELPLESAAEPSSPPGAPEPDLRAVIDDELRKLPPAYREVIVLCDVDGACRRDAARRLGIPDGTLSNRLSRARALLGRRLLRRGVTLGSGVCLSSAAAAAAPPRLVALTVSRITSAAVPAEVLSLTGAVMTPMAPFRLLSLAVLGLLAVGVSYLTLSAREPAEAQRPASSKPAEGEPPVPGPEVVTGWAPAAAFSRDGKWLALSLSETKAVKVYDAVTRKPVLTLKGPKQLSHALAFSADGGALYAACSDGLVYRWDTKSGKAGAALDAKAGRCYGLALSPDGKVLASGHDDPDNKKSAIQLWGAKTGRPIRALAANDYLLPNSLAFTPDGKTIAGGYHATHKDEKDVAGFHGVIEWDVATGKEVRRYAIPRVTPGATPVTHTIAFARDGKRVIVGGGEAVPTPGGRGCTCVGYLWVLDRKTGKVANTLIANNRADYVRQVALSDDGKKLFVPTHTPYRRVVRNGMPTEVALSALQCWDTATWKLDWSVEDEQATVAAVAILPNGKRVAVSNARGVFLLDSRTGEAKGELLRVKGR